MKSSKKRSCKQNAYDNFLDTNFSEKTVKEIDEFSERIMENRLKKSKSISTWLKFFLDFFSVSVDLKKCVVLKRRPGQSIVLVPEEIDIDLCIEILKKKTIVNIEMATIQTINSHTIKPLRRKEKTYVYYTRCLSNQSPTECTLLELVLIDLFQIYKTGKIQSCGLYGFQNTISKIDDNFVTLRKLSENSISVLTTKF